MKITKIIILVFFLQSLTFGVNSQSIVLVSGDLSILKGETRFGMMYNYDDMRVGKMSEEEYINMKVAEANQKKPGSGDKWANSWKADRAARYQPRFENWLNNDLQKKGVSANPGIKDSKYSIILKTTFTEPGYDVYVSMKRAMIDVEINFVETDNPSNVVVILTMKRIPGISDDFDSNSRIQESYARCGLKLAAYLVKKVFKKNKY